MSNSVKNPPENSAGSVAFPPSHLGELIIEITSYGYEGWIGTRAQLEAEGLIPSDVEANTRRHPAGKSLVKIPLRQVFSELPGRRAGPRAGPQPLEILIPRPGQPGGQP